MLRNKVFTLGAVLSIISTFALIGCLGSDSKTVDSNTTSNSSSHQENPNSNPSSSQGQGNSTGTSGSNPSTGPSSQTGNTGSTGQSGSSNNSGQTEVPAPTRTFPTIIDMAMVNFETNVLQNAKAPTVIPVDALGSNSLFYQTSQSTTPKQGYLGFLSNYKVQLNSPTLQLADFSGSRFDSTTNAGLAFQKTVGDVFATLGTKSTVDLGKDMKGIVTTDTAHMSSNVTWSEGRWQIRVTNTANAVIPMNAANQVVAYLDAHFMPVPHDKGAIMIDLKGSSIHADVIWQDQTQLYQIDTYTPCNDPIKTALAMAISMHSYS